MKKLLIVLIIVLSVFTIADVQAKKLPIGKKGVSVLDDDSNKEKICRYYAILVANQSGYPYGSSGWQQAFLEARVDCFDQVE